MHSADGLRYQWLDADMGAWTGRAVSPAKPPFLWTCSCWASSQHCKAASKTLLDALSLYPTTCLPSFAGNAAASSFDCLLNFCFGGGKLSALQALDTKSSGTRQPFSLYGSESSNQWRLCPYFWKVSQRKRERADSTPSTYLGLRSCLKGSRRYALIV